MTARRELRLCYRNGSNKQEVIKVKELPFTNDEDFMKHADLSLEQRGAGLRIGNRADQR
jgi:hypothetical protein